MINCSNLSYNKIRIQTWMLLGPSSVACRTNVKYDNVRTRRNRETAEHTPAYYFRVERS